MIKLTNTSARFASILVAITACASNVWAQTPTATDDQMHAVEDNALKNNTADAIYDPVVINPEISQTTSSKTQDARTILERTHDTPIPGPGSRNDNQLTALPGEDILDARVEQISELNEIKPGQAMTLREALLMADAQNLTLETARVKIQTAKAQLKQAWAIILPNISGTISYAHVYNNATAASMANAFKPIYESIGATAAGVGELAQQTGNEKLQELAQQIVAPLQNLGNASGSNTIDSVSMGLTVGLSLINVASWFQLRMADEAVDITELGIENGRQQILAGVAQAYMSTLLCGELVKIQRVQLKSALDQLTLAQGRYDRGIDVKLSVVQAQFGVEKQRQALIDAIWSYETARDALANLLNYDGLPVPQPSHIRPVEISSDENLEEEAIQNNRTLKINRMTQHVNELNLNAAISGFAPTLSGAWQFGYNLHPAGTPTWTLALSASIPIFDYSKYGLIDERKAAILETSLSMQSTEASTRTAVRKAKREYYSALFSLDNSKRQVELAREALQLTEAAYSNGASTFIDVSDARNAVASASIAYITSAIQSELSMLSLITTLGRDIMEIVY